MLHSDCITPGTATRGSCFFTESADGHLVVLGPAIKSFRFHGIKRLGALISCMSFAKHTLLEHVATLLQLASVAMVNIDVPSWITNSI